MELNNLTHLQKAALEGEIAFILSTSPHDAELKFRIYAILSEINECDRVYASRIIKEQVRLHEEVVDRILLEVENGEFPVWLWIEKTVEDLKESLSYGDTPSAPRLSLEKTECRKKLINSSFIVMARKVIVINPDVAIQLCGEIINCRELDFLKMSCFYISQWSTELKKVCSKVQNNEALKECCFDIRDRLSYQLENEALSIFSKPSDRKIPEHVRFPETGNLKENLKGNFETEPMTVTFNVDESEISTEELSNFLSQQITKLFTQNFKGGEESSPSRKLTYTVKKIYKDAPEQSVVLKEFETEEEARKFVRKIMKEFPELLTTCEYCISKNNSENNF